MCHKEFLLLVLTHLHSLTAADVRVRDDVIIRTQSRDIIIYRVSLTIILAVFNLAVFRPTAKPPNSNVPPIFLCLRYNVARKLTWEYCGFRGNEWILSVCTYLVMVMNRLDIDLNCSLHSYLSAALH